MLVPDVNVLLYAVDSTSPQHKAAAAWLETSLNGVEPVAFAWAVLLAFLRLGTNARIFARPMKTNQALGYVEQWCARPGSVVIHPGPGHLTILRSLLTATGIAGNLTSDAHLAALAIEHDAQLVSFDSDFSRFPSLRWFKPEG